MGPWTWFGGGFAILFIVGLIVLLVWGIAKLVQGGSSSSGGQGKSPLDIARERYARGEITQEEFKTLKKDLS